MEDARGAHGASLGPGPERSVVVPRVLGWGTGTRELLQCTERVGARFAPSALTLKRACSRARGAWVRGCPCVIESSAAPRPRLTPLPSPLQVAEGGPAREPLPLLEVSPRKRLPARPDQDPCGSRPAPEGAGAGAEQGHLASGGGWCRHCHTKLVELKRQAWKLVSGPGTPLRVSDPSPGRPLSGWAALEVGRP